MSSKRFSPFRGAGTSPTATTATATRATAAAAATTTAATRELRHKGIRRLLRRAVGLRDDLADDDVEIFLHVFASNDGLDAVCEPGHHADRLHVDSIAHPKHRGAWPG